jgi:hypothetical protein
MNVREYTPHHWLVRKLGYWLVVASQNLPDSDFSYRLYKKGLELSF